MMLLVISVLDLTGLWIAITAETGATALTMACQWPIIQPRPETGCHLIRPPKLDRPQAEFSGLAQGGGLVTPPDFASVIGNLLPIGWCGRSTL